MEKSGKTGPRPTCLLPEDSIYSTTPTATFTLTNTSATALLNFDSANDDGLTSFLTHAYPGGGSNGDTLTYLSGSGEPRTIASTTI